ncbi:SPFH domain-containing protein [Adlercreutzia aquisgranensis]|uniref:SPFH domain-containing protein n=1 Tax=Adlercreutzia aquisgranensis TaxID=2941323 RepID=UPI00203F1663|nr:SPFH domain-containing protein [Adlercreutzia aquisgranensis]
MAAFSCGQCGVRLSAAEGSDRYTCPLCGFDNDVQERLASEALRHDDLASVIKYEGDGNAFVWKSPIEDFRYGSQLIVHESQEAIFFKDGRALDLFGPGRYTLETQQLPLLDKAYVLPTGAEGTFHSEVYFINKAIHMAVKWGTPDRLRFIDPLTGVPLQIGASGSLNLQVTDSRKLIVKLVGTMRGIAWDDGPGFAQSLSESFRPLIANEVRTGLSKILVEEAIDILEIDAYLEVISRRLQERIAPSFDEYGLSIPQFYVTNIVLPEEDPHFQRIRELHTVTLQTRLYQAEAAVKVVQAQSEQQYRTAEEQSQAAIEAARREAVLQRQLTETETLRREAERAVIAAEAEAKAATLTGLAEAEVMRAKGYSELDTLQAEVQKAYAAGIGNMGSAGVSGGGGGITGDVMGMGIGLAMASAMAPQIGNVMQGMSPLGAGWSGQGAPAAASPNMWDCACGQRGNTGNYCGNCGQKRGGGSEA